MTAILEEQEKIKKPLTLQQWSTKFMNLEIVDRVYSWKLRNNFELTLYFDDFVQGYENYFKENSTDENAESLAFALNEHVKTIHTGFNTNFVDLKLYGFDYNQLLEHLQNWKNTKFFKKHGLTADVSEHITYHRKTLC